MSWCVCECILSSVKFPRLGDLSVTSLLLLFLFSSSFKCMQGYLIPDQNDVSLELLLIGLLLVLLLILKTSQAF